MAQVNTLTQMEVFILSSILETSSKVLQMISMPQETDTRAISNQTNEKDKEQ